MGSATHQSQCERFISAFGDEVLRKVKLKAYRGQQWLAESDGSEQVMLYVEVKDGKSGWRTLMDPQILFDPEEDDRDAVSRLSELLELEPREAAKRLAQAGLIDTGHGARFFP